MAEIAQPVQDVSKAGWRFAIRALDNGQNQGFESVNKNLNQHVQTQMAIDYLDLFDDPDPDDAGPDHRINAAEVRKAGHSWCLVGSLSDLEMQAVLLW